MHAENGDDGRGGSGRDGGNHLSLTLTNDLNEIPRLGEAVERFAGNHGVPTAAIDDVNIALDELVTNIIRYAHDDGQVHHIAVRLVLAAGALEIEIIDDGRAFNPLDRPPPDLASPLEERPVGGLGIHFVRTLMHDVGYSRENGKNVMRMTKRVG